MYRTQLDILEKAFSAQIDAAVSNGFGVIQTNSKIAKELADNGYLELVKITLPGQLPVTIVGYVLTIKGNLT